MVEHGMRDSLGAILRRAGRVEKFITLLLLFILLTAAAAGVTAVLTGPDWASLWESLLLGLLAGWGIAIFRWPAWRSSLILILLGVLFCLLFSGGLFEKILPIFEELFRQMGRFIPTLTIKQVDTTALLTVTRAFFTSIGVVLGRVYTWVKDLVTGQPAFDPVAAGIIWSLAVWMVAAWAGWVVEAGKNALVAVLPALLLNLSTLSYGRVNSATIYLNLGITLVLIAVVQHDRREQEWNETRVAYPARKSREIGNTSLILAICLVVVSALISSLSVQHIIDWTSKIRGSSPQTESGLAKSLGLLPVATAITDAFTNIRTPGLPRELLIGSGPELSTDIVMAVMVSNLQTLPDARLLPPLYWRSFTYDGYTGHGWSSSVTSISQYQSDQPIQPGQLPGHVLITQDVNPVPRHGGTIYADGEPVVLNVPTSAAWRSSNDLFGLQTESNAYEIQSLIPVVDEGSLRKAGQAYPNWVTQRYLAVPAEVPNRVSQLAIQLTAAEPTPYDRARAIEQYLRQTYPYSLDVPRPPANQDLVDYFLFDLRKGYCDYYASSMVILARAAGIPARLAVGYASGTYNEKSQRFIVSQADAHSWVEVYFPGIGWVPFEPTAGLPAIDRSVQLTQEATPTPVAVPTKPPAGVGGGINGKYIGLTVLALVTLLATSWVILDEIILIRQKPGLTAREVYRRMRRYGDLLRVPTQGGETPFEFVEALGARITEIARQGFSTGTGDASAVQAQSITRKIVLLSYRPAKPEPSLSAGIIRQWRSLRWRLRLVWGIMIWGTLRSSVSQPERQGASVR